MSDYFETMGIPIVQGRSFQQTDPASSVRVAVVNEVLANRYWKGLNPIGQRLRPCCFDAIPWYTVIGVAKDIQQGGVDRKPGTEFYRFVEQTASVPPLETMNVVLRTALPAAALSQTIERVVHEWILPQWHHSCEARSARKGGRDQPPAPAGFRDPFPDGDPNARLFLRTKSLPAKSAPRVWRSTSPTHCAVP